MGKNLDIEKDFGIDIDGVYDFFDDLIEIEIDYSGKLPSLSDLLTAGKRNWKDIPVEAFEHYAKTSLKVMSEKPSTKLTESISPLKKKTFDESSIRSDAEQIIKLSEASLKIRPSASIALRSESVYYCKINGVKTAIIKD